MVKGRRHAWDRIFSYMVDTFFLSFLGTQNFGATSTIQHLQFGYSRHVLNSLICSLFMFVWYSCWVKHWTPTHWFLFALLKPSPRHLYTKTPKQATKVSFPQCWRLSSWHFASFSSSRSPCRGLGFLTVPKDAREERMPALTQYFKNVFCSFHSFWVQTRVQKKPHWRWWSHHSGLQTFGTPFLAGALGRMTPTTNHHCYYYNSRLSWHPFPISINGLFPALTRCFDSSGKISPSNWRKLSAYSSEKRPEELREVTLLPWKSLIGGGKTGKPHQFWGLWGRQTCHNHPQSMYSSSYRNYQTSIANFKDN